MQQSKRTANEWNVRSEFFFDLVWVGCLFVCLFGWFVCRFGLVWFGLGCLFVYLLVVFALCSAAQHAPCVMILRHSRRLAQC